MITIVWDSTMFSSFQQCALQFDLAHNRDYEPNKTAEAIEEGSLVHALMEPYYESLKKGFKVKDAEEFALVQGREYAMDLDLDMGETEEIIDHFRQYVAYWGQEPDKILEVERPFLITLYQDEDIRVLYCGKIDLLVERHKDGQLMVRDHKKRRQNRAISVFSNQFIGYCIATKTTHLEVNSFGLQKSLPANEKFMRFPVSYPQQLKERWIKNCVWWAQQYVYHHKSGLWPENWTSCDKMSGCQFKPHCKSITPEQQEFVLHIQFRKRKTKWDPTLPLKEAAKKGKTPIQIVASDLIEVKE